MHLLPLLTGSLSSLGACWQIVTDRKRRRKTNWSFLSHTTAKRVAGMEWSVVRESLLTCAEAQCFVITCRTISSVCSVPASRFSEEVLSVVCELTDVHGLMTYIIILPEFERRSGRPRQVSGSKFCFFMRLILCFYLFLYLFLDCVRLVLWKVEGSDIKMRMVTNNVLHRNLPLQTLSFLSWFLQHMDAKFLCFFQSLPLSLYLSLSVCLSLSLCLCLFVCLSLFPLRLIPLVFWTEAAS